MRRWVICAVVFCGFLTSCTSEYEERMNQAKVLKTRLDRVYAAGNEGMEPPLTKEIKDIQSEIVFLAKVSGNEELFLRELYSH